MWTETALDVWGIKPQDANFSLFYWGFAAIKLQSFTLLDSRGCYLQNVFSQFSKQSIPIFAKSNGQLPIWFGKAFFSLSLTASALPSGLGSGESSSEWFTVYYSVFTKGQKDI